MTPEEFQTTLFENLDLPFEISEVAEIESNCGSMWINLLDGRSFVVMIEQCEDSEEE